MAKILKGPFKKSKDLQDIQEAKKSQKIALQHDLMKDHSCYVLITCSIPKENGDMEVEMIYEGDKALASYLLESAQGVLDEQMDISSQ